MGNCLNRTTADNISGSVRSSSSEEDGTMMSNKLQDALLAIENNAASFKELRIGQYGHIDQPNRDHFSRLGSAIARNTHLTLLIMNNGYCLDNVNDLSGFIEGLKRNSSIHRVMFHCGHHTDVIHETLKAYKENNNLTYLNIDNARIVSAAYPVLHLAETLRCCTNLKHINFENCRITDEQLLPLVEAVRGHELLEKLLLSENSIGNIGCEAIATLLEDPTCNIQVLSLPENIITNEGERFIAKSLSKNNKLHTLYLYNNRILVPSLYVEEAFTRALCDKSSINNTYSSNHKLEVLFLYPSSRKPGNQLNKLLKLNKDTNKSRVAMKKIASCHPEVLIDMKPFYEWDENGEQSLKSLPYIIAWFERLAVAVADVHCSFSIDIRRLSAIYQFARAMPLMFEPISRMEVDNLSNGGKSKAEGIKRKSDDM